MEINIYEHISEERMSEIAEEEFRRIVRDRLDDEKELTRIIGNSAYVKAFGILEEHLPEDWHATVSKKVKEIINDRSSYSIFRNHYSTNKPESTASKYVESVVIDNKDKITEMVNKLIDEKLNRDSQNHEVFVDRIIDSFYNDFTIKFERE